MHRALAKSESVLVNENGEIDVDQVKDYVSNFAASRPPNETFQVLIGQYSQVSPKFSKLIQWKLQIRDSEIRNKVPNLT